MTVAADLQEATGVRRRLFLRIDGYEYNLWQRGEEDPPDTGGGWSRDPLVCLHPPAEFSAGLDLTSMTVELDAMQFELEDIEESVGVSRFGKLFASARWDDNVHTRVTGGTSYSEYVDADAATIPVKSTTGFASPAGTAYMGQETFTYTGTTATSFTGCTRGLYPITGSNWAATQLRPVAKTHGMAVGVGVVPFSWTGRRVGLYVHTYDRATAGWNAEAQAVLLWCGFIDDSIDRDGQTGRYKLSCGSIMKQLDVKVPREQPTAHLQGINLLGDVGRFVDITVHSAGAQVNSTTNFELATSGYYNTPTDLFAEVNSQLDAIYSTKLWGIRVGAKRGNNGQGELWAVNAGGGDQTMRIRQAKKLTGATNHVLQAMGFDGRKEVVLHVNAGGAVTHKSATYYVEYHPLDQTCNGSRIYCTSTADAAADELIANQGDNSSAIAAFEIDDAQLDPYQAKTKGAYQGRYTAKTLTGTSGVAYLSLYLPEVSKVSVDGFVGSKAGDNRTVIEQIYIPTWAKDSDKAPRGPFELLLYPLLSTGTSTYNDATYDTMPLSFSVGMQADLVDKQSFLDADAVLKSKDLAQRRAYVISEGTSWLDLVKRECQLFGFVLRWAREQLSLTPSILPGVDDYDVTLDATNNLDPGEWPSEERSTDTVINRYVVKALYDRTSGKFGPEVKLNDIDSQQGQNGLIKEVAIEHPGIYIDDKSSLARSLLQAELIGRPLRWPSTVYQRTLAPTLLNRLYVGDVARVVSDRLMDPTGSGTMSVDTYGLVLNASWDFTEQAGYVGQATIMLLSQYASYGTPWAPSALVDKSKADPGWSGGLHNANDQLFLVAGQYGTGTDPDDGEPFASTWEIYIIERAPSDPTAPDIYGPYACASDYETDGASVLTLEAGAGAAIVAAGWDATKEHVVVFADYDEVVAGQVAKGTWQADETTELLNSADRAARYG